MAPPCPSIPPAPRLQAHRPTTIHLFSTGRRSATTGHCWAALASETYDARGNLWRVQYAYIGFLYDGMKSMYTEAYGGYDLVQGVYNINGKPVPGTFRNGVAESSKYFTAKGMARGGIRQAFLVTLTTREKLILMGNRRSADRAPASAANDNK